MEDNKIMFSDFGPLEAYAINAMTKTAYDTSDLNDAGYFAGLTYGIGADKEGLDDVTKIACCEVGREIMGQFIPYVMLDK